MFMVFKALTYQLDPSRSYSSTGQPVTDPGLRGRLQSLFQSWFKERADSPWHGLSQIPESFMHSVMQNLDLRDLSSLAIALSLSPQKTAWPVVSSAHWYPFGALNGEQARLAVNLTTVRLASITPQIRELANLPNLRVLDLTDKKGLKDLDVMDLSLLMDKGKPTRVLKIQPNAPRADRLSLASLALIDDVADRPWPQIDLGPCEAIIADVFNASSTHLSPRLQSAVVPPVSIQVRLDGLSDADFLVQAAGLPTVNTRELVLRQASSNPILLKKPRFHRWIAKLVIDTLHAESLVVEPMDLTGLLQQLPNLERLYLNNVDIDWDYLFSRQPEFGQSLVSIQAKSNQAFKRLWLVPGERSFPNLSNLHITNVDPSDIEVDLHVNWLPVIARAPNLRVIQLHLRDPRLSSEEISQIKTSVIQQLQQFARFDPSVVVNVQPRLLRSGVFGRV
ncbi:MAG TPA: hypothetical protein VGE55_09185 [Limnobacter sp.]|uniref:hypothetical protein n=1 Tax=Limnobacter sp. TaxID=2003368 RepID=UPI002ED8D7C1